MADAQNNPIQVVPDPKPAEVAPAAEPPTSRGRRAGTLLGLALVASLVGNGVQFVQNESLTSRLSQVTSERAAIRAERDAVSESLGEMEQALFDSKGAITLVHQGLGSVREQISSLESLIAPFGLAPTAQESDELTPSPSTAIESESGVSGAASTQNAPSAASGLDAAQTEAGDAEIGSAVPESGAARGDSEFVETLVDEIALAAEGASESAQAANDAVTGALAVPAEGDRLAASELDGPPATMAAAQALAASTDAAALAAGADIDSAPTSPSPGSEAADTQPGDGQPLR